MIQNQSVNNPYRTVDRAYANLTPDVFSIRRLILKRSSKWTLKFIELLNFTQSNTVKLRMKREFLSAIFVDPNRN